MLSFILVSALLLPAIFIGSIDTRADDTVFRVTNLKADYMTTPIGLDNKTPAFSWQMESSTRSQSQDKYKITVGTSPGTADMWDGTETLSGESVSVLYEGKELRPKTRYYWQVTVWNQDGAATKSEPAWFETGLMSIRQVDWSDGEGNTARFIGAKDYDVITEEPYYFKQSAHYTIEVDIQMTQNTATIVFDHRAGNHFNFWQFNRASMSI